jgi:ankyrin repeat protein
MGAKPDYEGLQSPYGLPLHAAIVCGRIAIVQRLIEHAGQGKDRLVRLRNSAGDTPLHIAAARNRIKEADMLLDAVDDVESYAVEKTRGFTALVIAERCRHHTIVRLLC